MVTDPGRFDVIVTDNLFGDIITDLAAAVSGGIGLAASGNIDASGVNPSMFEPVHGSAPDIAGQSKADPTAAILSVALLLATWATTPPHRPLCQGLSRAPAPRREIGRRIAAGSVERNDALPANRLVIRFAGRGGELTPLGGRAGRRRRRQPRRRERRQESPRR